MSSDRQDSLDNSNLEGLQNILDGKFDICQGLEDLHEALKRPSLRKRIRSRKKTC